MTVALVNLVNVPLASVVAVCLSAIAIATGVRTTKPVLALLAHPVFATRASRLEATPPAANPTQPGHPKVASESGGRITGCSSEACGCFDRRHAFCRLPPR
jgi:hypothetical protein